MPYSQLREIHNRLVMRACEHKDRGDIKKANIFLGRAYIVQCSAEQLLEEALGLYEDAERICDAEGV